MNPSERKLKIAEATKALLDYLNGVPEPLGDGVVVLWVVVGDGLLELTLEGRDLAARVLDVHVHDAGDIGQQEHRQEDDEGTQHASEKWDRFSMV